MAILAKIEKVRDELVQALTAAAGAQRADAVALALSEKKVAALTTENFRLQEIILQMKTELLDQQSWRPAPILVDHNTTQQSPISPKSRKAGSPTKSPSPWREDDAKERQQLFAVLEASRRK